MKFYEKWQQCQIAQESQHLHYSAAVYDRLQGPEIYQYVIEVYNYEKGDSEDRYSGCVFHCKNLSFV